MVRLLAIVQEPFHYTEKDCGKEVGKNVGGQGVLPDLLFFCGLVKFRLLS
jgi:hypothetical protein